MIDKDTFVKLAHEAGYFLYDLTETHGIKCVETDEVDEWAQLERFANLVASHAAAVEREECAQICDSYAKADHANYSDSCAKDIRARGTQ